MQHQHVSSSTIESVAHDPDTLKLEVKFKTGSTYHYHDVPADLHADMMASPSVGKFLNSEIKGKFDHSQV